MVDAAALTPTYRFDLLSTISATVRHFDGPTHRWPDTSA